MQSAKIQRQGKNLTESKQAKRNKHIYDEDFSRETMEQCKQLWKEVKAHRDKGRVAYISYRTVVVKKGGNFGK